MSVKKLKTSLWCENYFDILYHLRVDHQCDRQTDGQTDRMTFSNSAV